SPPPSEKAPAASPDTPAINSADELAAAPATPATNPAVDVIPSLAPNTAARNRFNLLTEVDSRCADACPGHSAGPGDASRPIGSSGGSDHGVYAGIGASR